MEMPSNEAAGVVERVLGKTAARVLISVMLWAQHSRLSIAVSSTLNELLGNFIVKRNSWWPDISGAPWVRLNVDEVGF
jgi:hypothetical protein